MNNQSPQPKVIACQGKEEMFKSRSEKKDSCLKVAHQTQNSFGDILLNKIRSDNTYTNYGNI